MALSPPVTRPARRLADWRPEDPQFWAATGRATARRNLILSILCEHIGFSVWSLWSVTVLFLGPDYGLTPAQKFTLTSVPTAVGAVLRLPYSHAVVRFGGRTWTVVSALLLLIPSIALAAALHPGVSYRTLLWLSALAGVGGGNFASSMTNINSFYPQRLKGWALGLNAGGGNIGVAAVQLVGLLVLATAGKGHPGLVAGIYVPLIVLAALAAALFMDNIPATAARGTMRAAAGARHTWIMSLLYIGTFGSFIGFGFAFGQVLQVQFAGDFATPIDAAYLTFLGPLVGSLARPLGGRLADRIGGARVTLATFAAMGLAAAVVLAASLAHSLPAFLTGFVLLFLLSGIGNGSTYKMIPALFQAEAVSGAVIGIAGAVGAFGGVLVNLAFRQSFLSTGSGDRAYLAFIVAYVLLAVLTWAVYLRPGRTMA